MTRLTHQYIHEAAEHEIEAGLARDLKVTRNHLYLALNALHGVDRSDLDDDTCVSLAEDEARIENRMNAVDEKIAILRECPEWERDE